jgi:hypothetical protein
MPASAASSAGHLNSPVPQSERTGDDVTDLNDTTVRGVMDQIVASVPHCPRTCGWSSRCCAMDAAVSVGDSIRRAPQRRREGGLPRVSQEHQEVENLAVAQAHLQSRYDTKTRPQLDELRKALRSMGIENAQFWATPSARRALTAA